MCGTQELPTISVITASFNRGHLIDQAVQSVVRQGYPHLEHIVIDGGSSDDTVERLARHRQLKVVSEPDQGVYDAFNKGLRLATGEIIAFVNSDDLLPDGVLIKVGRAFSERPTVDMVCGRAAVFSDDSEGQRLRRAEFRELAASRLTLEGLQWRTPMLNARFIRRRVYETLGPFDPGWRVESDFDFMIVLARARIHSVYLDDVVYLYRQHPDSLSMGQDRSAFWPERLGILEKHFRDSELSARDRRILRRWHSWLIANAMSVRLLHGGDIPLRECLVLGIRRDWLFMPRMLGYALARVGRLRGARSR